MIYIITFLVILITTIIIKFKGYNNIPKMEDWWSAEIEKANYFDFSEIVPKTDKSFWVGKSCYITDGTNCIIHIKTNLVLSIDGELLGRFHNGEFIDVNDLPNNIKEWYTACGF
jgi:hypothetical protein